MHRNGQAPCMEAEKTVESASAITPNVDSHGRTLSQSGLSTTDVQHELTTLVCFVSASTIYKEKPHTLPI